MVAAGYVISFVTIRRAGNVATNAAASGAAGRLANALMELRSLSQSVCYLTNQ